MWVTATGAQRHARLNAMLGEGEGGVALPATGVRVCHPGKILKLQMGNPAF